MSAMPNVLYSAQRKEKAQPVRLAPISFSGSPAKANRSPVLMPPWPDAMVPGHTEKVSEIPAQKIPRQTQRLTAITAVAGTVFSGEPYSAVPFLPTLRLS
jgi:hypothetical protein